MQQKKFKSLGNNNDIADQKTGRNDNKTFGIPRANLELKYIIFIICSYYGHLFIIYFNSVQ